MKAAKIILKILWNLVKLGYNLVVLTLSWFAIGIGLKSFKEKYDDYGVRPETGRFCTIYHKKETNEHVNKLIDDAGIGWDWWLGRGERVQ